MIMRAVLWMMLLAAARATAAAAAAPPAAAAKKIAGLEALRRSSGGGPALRATDANLHTYLATGPRPYDLFIMFTALSPQYRCAVCRAGVQEFEVAAAQHAQAAAAAGRGGGGRAARPAFFMVADVDLNRKVFQGYELQSVPQVAHFAPEAAPGAGAGWPQADMMPVTKLFTAEDIAQFVGDKTGFRYTIYRSQFAARMALLALIFFLIGALRTAITNVALVLRVIRSPTLWLVVSLLVYTFSISGAIFDIIRSPPPFVISAQTRKPVYFSPQPNSQYVVEGFIVGILNLTTAFCGMVVVAIAPRIKARALRQTVTLAAAALFGLLFTLSVTIYTWKNRWYMAR